MAKWCAGVVHECDFHQVGADPEDLDLRANESRSSATRIDVERMLTIGIARIDAIQIVRKFNTVHDDAVELAVMDVFVHPVTMPPAASSRLKVNFTNPLSRTST